MSYTKLHRFVYARNIILVLLLFFGLKIENADAQRYGTLLSLMICYVLWIRLREFPFMRKKRLYYASFWVDVIFIALINYHSMINPNYFFLLLYYLSIVNAGVYLGAVKGLAVNVFTFAVLLLNLIGPGENFNNFMPLLLGLPAAVPVAVIYLVKRHGTG